MRDLYIEGWAGEQRLAGIRIEAKAIIGAQVTKLSTNKCNGRDPRGQCSRNANFRTMDPIVYDRKMCRLCIVQYVQRSEQAVVNQLLVGNEGNEGSVAVRFLPLFASIRLQRGSAMTVNTNGDASAPLCWSS